MQPRPLLFNLDPHNPETGIATYLQEVNRGLAYIDQDDGKLIAFRYNSDDLTALRQIMRRQAYAMLRPTEEATKAHLDTVDYYMSEKIVREHPEKLQELFAQDLEIIGYIDNHYNDLFGLVFSDKEFGTYKQVILGNGQPGITQRMVDGMVYMSLKDAEAAQDQWLAADVPTLAESKQPFIDMLNESKKKLEEMQLQDWSRVKESAMLDDATKNQTHPGLN